MAPRPVAIVIGILAAAVGAMAIAFAIARVLDHRRFEDRADTGPTARTADAAASQRSDAAPPVPVPRTAEQIRTERQRLDRTVWAKEVAAQEHEEAFVALWDAMRAHPGRQHEDLAAFAFTSLAIATFAAPTAHPWNVSVAEMAGEPTVLDQDGWRRLIERLAVMGYRLEHSEWHHATFDEAVAGSEGASPARSTVSIKLFVVQPVERRRLVVNGVITVVWSARLDAKGHHVAESIDASRLKLTERIGDDAFVDAWTASPGDLGADLDSTVDPVLVSDLDRDGCADIVLPSINAVLLNKGKPGTVAFERRPLFEHPLSVNSNVATPYITAGIVGDFTGDGLPDIVVAGPELPPSLFTGSVGGAFTTAGQAIGGLRKEDMRLPECMTAGDVDGDGRLDLWIGQYRRPYEDGNLPTPYWDANDGWPSFLLLNSGGGAFRDATVASGLAAKRNRRNYSASIVDLDADGDADLLTVNDFSGVDVFRNDGHGGFVDATDAMIDERATFGMSHAIADVDGDGLIDIFISGMGSTTARRLDYMKLGRAEFPEHQRERMRMGYGNRLLLGTRDHRYAQAPANDLVARTGWSWGCTALDVANTGAVDLFLTNGNMSRASAKDYCTRYWTHDIYASPSTPSDAVASFFLGEAKGLAGYSWNPFEHKALLMNDGGKAEAFRDVAFPMGVGFEWDGRQAVSEDFDGDGMVDLLAVETRAGARPYEPLHPLLHVLRNAMPRTNHGIAVRLQDEPGRSPMGARITVTAGGSTRVAVIVSGDSYRCQHSAAKHFGLGALERVDAIEVHWADGATKRIESPTVDQVVLVLH